MTALPSLFRPPTYEAPDPFEAFAEAIAEVEKSNPLGDLSTLGALPR